MDALRSVAAPPAQAVRNSRRQLRVLKEFCERIEIWNLHPVPEAASSMAMRYMDVAVIGQAGKRYVAYVEGRPTTPSRFGLMLALGKWNVEWIVPATGNILKREEIDFKGGWGWWTDVPQTSGDIAVHVWRD